MKLLLSMSAAALVGAVSMTVSAEAMLPPPGEAPSKGALAAATEGPSKVIVWTAADEDTTLYLMGTVHILDPEISWQNDTVEAAWKASNTVYFEADVISPEAVQGAAPLLMSLGFDGTGKALTSYYSDAEQVEINNALGAFGLSVGAFQNMRPWLASIQTAQVALQSIGGSAEGGVEMILGKRAQAEGKNLRFFETVEEQLQMLAGETDDAQAKIFLDGMKDLQNVEGYFADLVGAWYHGENEKLAEMIQEGVAAAPEVAEALLYNRNKQWAETLTTVMEEEAGTFFVAVGAGHLGGELSVQDYLAEAGIKVMRVE